MNIENTEIHRQSAANSYVAMVVYMMKNSERVYPPNVARAVMDLVDSFENNSNEIDIWDNYAELVREANLEQIDVEFAPLRAIKQMVGN